MIFILNYFLVDRIRLRKFHKYNIFILLKTTFFLFKVRNHDNLVSKIKNGFQILPELPNPG